MFGAYNGIFRPILATDKFLDHPNQYDILSKIGFSVASCIMKNLSGE
jgi:hypothetical protein